MKTVNEVWANYCSLIDNRKTFFKHLEMLRMGKIPSDQLHDAHKICTLFVNFLSNATNPELHSFITLLNSVNSRQQDKALEEIKSTYIQVIEAIQQEKING